MLAFGTARRRELKAFPWAASGDKPDWPGMRLRIPSGLQASPSGLGWRRVSTSCTGRPGELQRSKSGTAHDGQRGLRMTLFPRRQHRAFRAMTWMKSSGSGKQKRCTVSARDELRPLGVSFATCHSLHRVSVHAMDRERQIFCPQEEPELSLSCAFRQCTGEATFATPELPWPHVLRL